MAKKFLQRMLSFIALMMLMMATSLSASAAFYLKGSVVGWDEGVEMTQDADGYWTITRDFAVDEQFKFYDSQVGWVGAQADGETFWMTESMFNNGTLINVFSGDAYKNLQVKKAGTYKIILDASGNQFKMRMGAVAPIEVETATGGTIAVNKSSAIPGETITITVTPGEGNYIERDNITVEKTVNGGSAQAPGRNATGPGVGSFVDVTGDPTNSVDQVNTYTFTMPEAPYGVMVSAEFLARIALTEDNVGDISVQPYTGEEIKPGVTVTVDGNVLTEGVDYTVTYSDNVNPGAATATITGIGKYTGTVTTNFTIAPTSYNITVIQPENGTLSANKETAVEAEAVELTATPNKGYELDHFIVTRDDNGVLVRVQDDNSFRMPASDVTVKAVFRQKMDAFYIATSTNWETPIAMTYNETDRSFSAKVSVTNGMQFKFFDENDDWFGPNGGTSNYNVHRNHCTDIGMWASTDNSNFQITLEGAESLELTFTVSAQQMLTVTGWDYFITVAQAENGSVSVENTVVKEGDVITVNTTPNAGYELDAIIVTQGINKYPVNVNEDGTFTMPRGDVEVSATFKAIEYTITVVQPENGTIAVADDKTTAHVGDVITLTNTPNEDCIFVSYTVTDAENNPVTVENNQFTMPASNVTVSATFRALDINYVIKWGIGDNWETVNDVVLTKDEAGKWTAAGVEMPADAKFKVVKVAADGENDPVLTWLGGDNVTITAEIQEIQLAETGQNIAFSNAGTYGFSFDPATGKLVVTGDFYYNITVAETTNGTVTTNPADKAKAGAEVAVTVTPTDGYEIESLTYTVEGGEPVAIEDNKFTMPAADVTINATFKESVVTYIYMIENEVNCIITGGSGHAAAGDIVTLRLVGESGTKFKDASVIMVTGDDQTRVETPIEFGLTPVEGSERDLDLTFVMPAGNVEISATYATVYRVIVNAGEHGSAEANVTEAYEGESVIVTVTPNPEYKVDQFTYSYTIDGREVTGELSEVESGKYPFIMPAADVTINVTFKTIINYFNLKFDAQNTGGTVAVKANGTAIESMAQVAEGVLVKVTVTPAENYEVESFKVVEGIVMTVDDEPYDDEFGAPRINAVGDEVDYTIEDGVYNFVMPSSDATILVTFKLSQVELEGVAFTADRHWATYYNGTQDLELPEGVKAYVVDDVVNDATAITEIAYIPAGVGVLLYSDVEGENLMTNIYSGITSTFESLLVGSDEGQAITNGYVLYNDTFIRSKEGTVAAHRCYLPMTEVPAGAPAILKIGVSGLPTAIQDIIAEGNVAGIKYVNLNGLTSNEPFRGVNIAVITLNDGTTRTIKVVK